MNHERIEYAGVSVGQTVIVKSMDRKGRVRGFGPYGEFGQVLFQVRLHRSGIVRECHRHEIAVLPRNRRRP